MFRKFRFLICFVIILCAFIPNVYGMHIMEGYLAPKWCIGWGILAAPFVIMGFCSIKKIVEKNPKLKLLLAMAGAFAFVLSALKIPSLTGSCSHPTGVGFGAILFGPLAMSLIGFIVLLFQALLLAHGGLTTLGANTFSMAVAGPFVSYGIYKLVMKMKGNQGLAVFLAAALGDLFTYVVTSIQLAMAYPSEIGGFVESFTKFSSIFALTQIPLAISEGLLTLLIFRGVTSYFGEEMKSFKILAGGKKNEKEYMY